MAARASLPPCRNQEDVAELRCPLTGLLPLCPCVDVHGRVWDKWVSMPLVHATAGVACPRDSSAHSLTLQLLQGPLLCSQLRDVCHCKLKHPRLDELKDDPDTRALVADLLRQRSAVLHRAVPVDTFATARKVYERVHKTLRENEDELHALYQRVCELARTKRFSGTKVRPFAAQHAAAAKYCEPVPCTLRNGGARGVWPRPGTPARVRRSVGTGGATPQLRPMASAPKSTGMLLTGRTGTLSAARSHAAAVHRHGRARHRAVEASRHLLLVSAPAYPPRRAARCG
jgi:hypothetical protein